MNRKPTARVLDDIARAHVPEHTNLLPQITARMDKENKLIMKTKTRLLIVALFVLMAVAVTLVSFPGVVTAMQRLFGYIPGVGIVEENAPIRVLAAPVTITREGISVTVTSATLTGDQTHIEYRIFGVPRSAYPDNEAITGCLEREALVLPDGTRLTPLQNFPPIPTGVNQATLVIPCIFNTLPGKAPDNWQIPLSFVPAPPDLTVMPVIELSPSPQAQPSATPAAAIAESANSTAQATLTSAPPVDSSITVDKVIETADGYILIGKFSPPVKPGDWIQQTGMMQILDASGKKVPYTQPNDISPSINVDPSVAQFGWVMQFRAAGLTYPLTITLPGTMITQADPNATAEFTFDAGSDPQPGQEWTPDQEIQLAGHMLKLARIDVDSRNGYGFMFESDAKVSAVSLQIEGYQAVGGGGGGGGGGSGAEAKSSFNVSVAYRDLPKGKLKVILSKLTVLGDALTWQGQWSPANPRTDWPAAPTAQPGMCLSIDQINQLQPAPAELTHGAALFYEQLSKPGDTNEKWGVVLYPLDGTSGQGQVVAPDASWGTLSLDGSKAAYPAQDGIHVVDLATQAETVLAATGGFDLHLSPDSSQIAFVSSSADNVSIIDSGGSAPARRISDQSYESVIGWSPDSRQVYIAIPYTGGSAWKVQAIDITTNAARDLFTIENGSAKSLGAAISPDGNWIAYRGQENDSLILVRTDGSQMHQVIELSGGITGIAWSKSGWIGLSLYNPDNYERRIVLLQPDNCQAYVLPGLHGDLEGLFLP